jgi:ATP-binding cassette, subfamily C, bacteriocin exporter
MKKIIKIRQHDITDCGATCLASVSAYYGLNFPVSRIRQYASTDRKGTNVLGMIEAAQKLGFSAKGVKGPMESLPKIPLPAIAHLVINKTLHHFVVIYQVTGRYILIMDPADGEIHKKTLDTFKEEWTGILVLLIPAETFSIGNNSVSVTDRFIQLITPHKSIMIQALFGAAVYSILGLSTSIFIEKIIDYVLVDGNLNLLNLMGIIMIILLGLKVFIGSMKSHFALKTGQKIDATLILGYYKHLLSLPQQFFDTMRVGEIISRVNDAVKIRLFINNVSLDLSVNILVVLFTLFLMLIKSWKLTLLVAISIPIFSIIYFIYNKLNKKNLRKVMENAAELESQFIESLNSISTIKRFGIEDFSNHKTEIKFIKLLQTTFINAKNSILTGNSLEFISGAVIIAILWVGSVKVVNQEMTPGTLISFYALVGYLLGPISYLISSNQIIQDAMIASDRLFQIMDLEQEVNEDKKINITNEIIGDIKFENVSFRYGSRKQVFENLNLTIPKNQITAITGESGSGKTTLLALMQNLYPIQSGNIYIGDYNLKHIKTKDIRKLIATVPQNIELFAGSVTENIAFGEFEPDMKQVIDICQNLQITEFIEKLPNGFNSYLGEHGVSLSGGEKQRIAIARALYRNPEILILDEATSALDVISESFVKNTIIALKSKGKTIIVITHRLNTIMEADNIVFLENGKVCETGTHSELIQKKNGYFHLWKSSFPELVKF